MRGKKLDSLRLNSFYSDFWVSSTELAAGEVKTNKMWTLPLRETNDHMEKEEASNSLLLNAG